MKEPRHILEAGTKVLTHQVLEPTTGMMIRQDYLDARRPNAKATLGDVVPGHGGDIYWARHEDGSVAAYGWMDFEYDTSAAHETTRYDHIRNSDDDFG